MSKIIDLGNNVMMQIDCASCDFFQPGGSGINGKCRINPPAQSHIWPSVAHDDWCGQWEQRSAKVKVQPFSTGPLQKPTQPFPYGHQHYTVGQHYTNTTSNSLGQWKGELISEDNGPKSIMDSFRKRARKKA